MPAYKIGGNTVHLLNDHELKDALTKTQIGYFQEMSRGVKPITIPASVATVSSGNLTLPDTTMGQTLGPKAGYAWMITRISVFPIKGGDVLQIYKNSVDPSSFVDQVSATAPTVYLGEKGLILKGNEKLFITGSGLTTTGDVIVNGEALEVAEADLWKLIAS